MDCQRNGVNMEIEDQEKEINLQPELIGMAEWGSIGGDIENQTDLQELLTEKMSEKMDKVNPSGSGTLNFGTNTTTISDTSAATGINTIAGSKAFRILMIAGSDTNRQLVLDSVEGIAVGDVCSAYIKDIEKAGGKDRTDNFDVFGKVEIIDTSDNAIILDGGFEWEWEYSTQESYLWVKGKPNVGTMIIGDNAMAFGESTIAQNDGSVSQGRGTKAVGKYSVATGRDNEANGYSSATFGRNNKANGKYSLASGRYTEANGECSHAEGQGSSATPLSASGQASHAEGYGTQAIGTTAHAEGNKTQANGNYSHSEGSTTIANGPYQHVAGKNNVADETSARITGWGTTTAKKNIEQLTNDGTLRLSGDVYVGCNNDSSGGNKVLISSDIADKQDKTDESLETLDKTIVGAINEIDGKFSNYVAIDDIINDTNHTDADKPLSANMGKELQDEIDNLKSIGRFLSLWNCSSGIPTTNPQTSPYIYKTGDYYIVKTVGTINYKPTGSSYVIGTISRTPETSSVNVGDIYYYDGSTWRLQINTQKTVTFNNIAGEPLDNSNLAAEFNKYVTKEGGTITGAITIANQEPTGCKLMFTRANGAYIQNRADGPINITLGITTNAALSYRFLSTAFLYGTDNARDLGASNTRWKNLYIAGNISDGTNNVSVANIATKSSFVTLTQAEYDALVEAGTVNPNTYYFIVEN